MSRSPPPPPRSRPQVELRNNLPTCRQSSRKASEVCGWSLALIEEFNPSPRGDGDVSEGRKDGRFCPTDARGGGSWHGHLRPPTPPRLLRWGLWAAFAAPAVAGAAGSASGRRQAKPPGCSTDRDTTGAAPGRWQRGSGLASAERRSLSPQPGLSLPDPGLLRRPAPSQLLAAPAPLRSPVGLSPTPAGPARRARRGLPGDGSLRGHPGPAAPPQPQPPCSGPLPVVPARLRQGRAAPGAAKSGSPCPAPPRPSALTCRRPGHGSAAAAPAPLLGGGGGSSSNSGGSSAPLPSAPQRGAAPAPAPPSAPRPAGPAPPGERRPRQVSPAPHTEPPRITSAV